MIDNELPLLFLPFAAAVGIPSPSFLERSAGMVVLYGKRYDGAFCEFSLERRIRKAACGTFEAGVEI